MERRIVCAVCGKEIVTKWARKKYCSERCAKQGYYALHREEQLTRQSNQYKRKKEQEAYQCWLSSAPKYAQKLKADMRAAESHGLSYGKYMAAKETGLIKQ